METNGAWSKNKCGLCSDGPREGATVELILL
jgi:hypothetical protein